MAVNKNKYFFIIMIQMLVYFQHRRWKESIKEIKRGYRNLTSEVEAEKENTKQPDNKKN